MWYWDCVCCVRLFYIKRRKVKRERDPNIKHGRCAGESPSPTRGRERSLDFMLIEEPCRERSYGVHTRQRLGNTEHPDTNTLNTPLSTAENNLTFTTLH